MRRRRVRLIQNNEQEKKLTIPQENVIRHFSISATAFASCLLSRRPRNLSVHYHRKEKVTKEQQQQQIRLSFGLLRLCESTNYKYKMV